MFTYKLMILILHTAVLATINNKKEHQRNVVLVYQTAGCLSHLEVPSHEHNNYTHLTN